MKYSMEKNQKIKLIFLDYDGVVNNLIFHTIDGEPDFYYRPLNEYSGLDRQVNDFQAVAWLNKICREFNCKVVVTSTWRGRDDYAECLYRAGFKGEIIGRTPWLGTKRGKEIFVWLNKEENQNIVKDIDDFIILDDDADMEMYMPHLIQTNTYRGLGFEEYQKICKRWEGDKNEQISEKSENKVKRTSI